MKPSFYNMIIDYPEEAKTVLFNSLYGSIILLDESEKENITNLLNNGSLIDKKDKINSVLIEQKFLIENDIKEIEIIKNRKCKGIDDSNRLDIIFMPTLNCNFACNYCYEEHIESSISNEFEKSIIKWLENEVPKFKFVLIHWFGGEPLMELKRVLKISKEIITITEKHNVELSLHITTNGFLLTKSNIEKLVDCGIIDYQITLDGIKKYHDDLRTLKNGKPTFNKVFNNIINLAEYNSKVKISLRVNFNHTNFDSIPELLMLFPKNIRKQLRVVFEPIFGNCSINAVDNIAHTEISEKLSNYYHLAKELGYDIIIGLNNINSGKLVYCYAERINHYVINYNGDVFKCSVCDFTSNERVGYINRNGEFVKEIINYSKWINENLFDKKCYQCQYLPLCLGGCKKIRIEQDKSESSCTLIPTNTNYLLKKIALNGLNNLIKEEVI